MRSIESVRLVTALTLLMALLLMFTGCPVRVGPSQLPPGRKHLAKVAELLGTIGTGDRLRWLMVEGDTEAESREIGIRPRSLLGILYFLSEGVAVPEADEESGKVTITRDDDGNPFDWRPLTDGLLQVHGSPNAPSAGSSVVSSRASDRDAKANGDLLTHRKKYLLSGSGSREERVPGR